jgi:2-dehydropantoate 2-reductase
MRIAIFGVGAMGCLFGARLTPHADVTLIGRWAEQIAALRSHPLRVIEPDGQESEVEVCVTDDAGSLPPVDVALILTKAAGTERAAIHAARLLRSTGIAITLQNGLGNLEIIAEHVGAERAALGVTTQGGATDGPGVLRVGGTGKTHLATRPEINGRVWALASVFEQAGMITELVEDVSALVWGKLVVNCAINPLTALLRVRNGGLVDSQWARQIMAEAAREVAAVAAAQEIALPFADPAARAEEVARLTAPNRSSMLQDVERGAVTEIEAICGAVMRQGEALSVPTPVNSTLYRLIKAIEETQLRSVGIGA